MFEVVHMDAASLTRESVQGEFPSLTRVFWFFLAEEPVVVRFFDESA